MIPTITAKAAQALARGGLAQLVDGTWQMPGSSPVCGSWNGTTATVDTSALKALAHDSRAALSMGVFADSGLTADAPICVYDRAGFFSAPWIAWLLASHGHSVSLVSGQAEAGDMASHDGEPIASLSDPAHMNATRADVLAALGTDIQIVDARPAERIAGTAPEPRPECRSGRIPGSLNLPFGTMKDGANYRDYEDLAALTRHAGIDLSRQIITSCGSGVTASAIAVVLKRLGAEDVRVYQGSWAEWGIDPKLPIETGS